MKTFYRQDNIGKAKYTINYHDGISLHNDGSPFFSMRIFRNKKNMYDFIKNLVLNGYRYQRM